MTTKTSHLIVEFMTAPSGEEASRLAEMLVSTKLAACVQILPPMESVYRWQGQVRHEREVLLAVKTTGAKFAELEREVRAQHSYEVPEIVAVPVTAVSQPYLKWVIETLEPA